MKIQRHFTEDNQSPYNGINFKKVTKKNKSKFKINYRVSGEAFLTKPNKTTYLVQNVVKKIKL